MFLDGFGIYGAISTAINLLLGGSLIWVFTIGSQRRKAASEADQLKAHAKSAELGNVREIIQLWQDTATELRRELKASREQQATTNQKIEQLSMEMSRMRGTINRISCKVNKMNSENWDEVLKQVKDLLQREEGNA